MIARDKYLVQSVIKDQEFLFVFFLDSPAKKCFLACYDLQNQVTIMKLEVGDEKMKLGELKIFQDMLVLTYDKRARGNTRGSCKLFQIIKIKNRDD